MVVAVALEVMIIFRYAGANRFYEWAILFWWGGEELFI